jgi:hypothetical protein
LLIGGALAIRLVARYPAVVVALRATKGDENLRGIEALLP